MGSASLKGNEPSMEEILASIRRIIADDEVQRPPEVEEADSSPLKNVLDIAELHVSPLIASGANEPVLGPWSRGQALPDEAEEDPTSVASVAARDGSVFADSLDARGAGVADAAPMPATEPSRAERLLSSEAGASVSGAFDRLSASLAPRQPQTVEDLMKEMLRPMLKAWLDDNLPPLVERLVREEIERLARRRA